MFLRTVAALTVVATGLATGGAQARVPSDPLAATWTYGAVNLPAAWDVTTGSEGVVIAIVDSGVDASHPDLAGAVDAGYDFVDEDQEASDENGHGTAVAGIAAGRADNGLGAAGVCWRCRIMPLRVIGPDGFARWIRIANAIDYAVEHGAAVVNTSIYGESIDPVCSTRSSGRAQPACSSSQLPATKGARCRSIRRPSPRRCRSRPRPSRTSSRATRVAATG